MLKSQSKYVMCQSISINDLMRSEPGTFGFYVLKTLPGKKLNHSAQRVMSQAKSAAHDHGKRCLTQMVLITSGLDSQTDDLETSRMLKITVLARENVSLKSEVYQQAQKKVNSDNGSPGLT